jgi:hypothetical protein
VKNAHRKRFLVTTYDAFVGLVFVVNFLHPQNVVAKVQSLELSSLTQKYDDRATSPVQSLAKKLPGVNTNSTRLNELKNNNTNEPKDN